MKFQKIVLFLMILALSLQICLGQNINENQPEENWLKQYNIYNEQFLFHRYDRYSKEDIVKFRGKLDSLKDVEFSNEWEGNYFSDTELLGYSSLIWNSNTGFINFYIYTCLPELRYLNYGKVINLPDSIQLFPEFAGNSPRKAIPIKYVKVKWNDRNYLVEESSLAAFAEKAVGIYVETNETSEDGFQSWSRYWVKGDLEKDLVGLPEFPANYKKFQRFPIEAKIISVGKRTIEEEKALGDKSHTQYFSEAAWYVVTIDAGKDRDVKKGIWLSIPETEDELFITQVNEKTSIGLIHREIDDNKNDLCSDENFNAVSCPKVKTSLKVKTKIGHFWF